MEEDDGIDAISEKGAVFLDCLTALDLIFSSVAPNENATPYVVLIQTICQCQGLRRLLKSHLSPKIWNTGETQESFRSRSPCQLNNWDIQWENILCICGCVG